MKKEFVIHKKSLYDAMSKCKEGEITFKKLLEKLCESGEKISVSYKTLDMETPEEYEGTFQRDPSNGNIILVI